MLWYQLHKVWSTKGAGEHQQLPVEMEPLGSSLRGSSSSTFLPRTLLRVLGSGFSDLSGLAEGPKGRSSDFFLKLIFCLCSSLYFSRSLCCNKKKTASSSTLPSPVLDMSLSGLLHKAPAAAAVWQTLVVYVSINHEKFYFSFAISLPDFQVQRQRI